MNLAFVVGCSAYADPIPSLKYAARDAERFVAALRDTCGLSREEIYLLCDAAGEKRRPEYTSVLRMLSHGRQSVSDGVSVDVLFFFFSGHGYHSLDTGEDYLLMSDSVADDLEATALSLPNVTKRLAKWKPRHLVLFVDACRETFGEGKALPLEAFAAPDVDTVLQSGQVTFCSCSAGERSYESDTVSSGLFTEALCEALSDKGRCRTLYELNKYVTKRVPELCTAAGKRRQTPVARLEPAEVFGLEIVSARIRNLWRANVPIGSEQRRRRVPRHSGQGGYVGIDFGTCNSLIGLLRPPDGDIEVIPEPSDGRGLVPSVVNFSSDLEYHVGWDALDADRTRPEGTIWHVKRALGTSRQFQIYDRSLTPEFVTSLILRSLKQNAEEYLGAPLGPVVAGYPASFSIAQQNSLAVAFEMAGINVTRFVGEPSAAAMLLPQSSKPESDEWGVVIDLGGGTLDVSVVERDHSDKDFNMFDIKGTAGDGKLGGIDYDQILTDYLTTQVCKLTDRTNLPRHITAEIRREAERAKHVLTSELQCPVVFSNVEFTRGDTRDIHINVDRYNFAALSAHLSRAIELTIERAIRNAEYTDSHGQELKSHPRFDFVMLAGQSTKIPILREAISKLIDAPILSKHQDDAVLRGLALQSSVLTGQRKDIGLLDSFYRGIGVWLRPPPYRDAEGNEYEEWSLEGDDKLNNSLYVLMERGTAIPTSRYEVVAAPAGGDTVRRLRIVELDRQGHDAVATPIGVVEINTQGEEKQLELGINVDANAAIDLVIRDLGRGDSRRIRLNSRTRHNDDDELITEQRLTGSLDAAAST